MYNLFSTKPTESKEYLVAFTHTTIPGDYLYHICFYEVKVGWCPDLPHETLDFRQAVAWCNVPRVDDVIGVSKNER
jgi:hypothetical protein